MSSLTLDTIRDALSGHAAAFRRITDYQPAGGPGDKVFPPTYEGGKYATETRIIDDKPVDCVLMDSVQSQANRMELGLLDAHWDNKIALPLVVVRFDQEPLLKKFMVTSLDAPHRVADAIFRDSYLSNVLFRHSDKGRLLDSADVRNATGLFGLNPTALVFGIWDSTGPRGGLGAKFQRSMVSEITGLDAMAGVRTSSRIDPAQIMLSAGPLYHRKTRGTDMPDWTLNEKLGGKKLGKDGKPSEANHGNVTPGISAGGFTISKAVQTTVLSLTCLRRLRFPVGNELRSDPRVDLAARTTLAALGLAAATLSHGQMTDLRSRCQLFPVAQGDWQLLDEPGAEPKRYSLSIDESIANLTEAVAAAKQAGLPWDGEIELQPSPELVELVRRSQELATATGEGES